MRKINLAWAVVMACGGSDNTLIGDSGTDGSGNDATVNDTGTSDSGKDTGNSDTGSDAGDAGTFDVGSVPNLVIWLKGDLASSLTTLNNDAGVPTVTKWADQTTHHNDAIGAAQFVGRNPTVKANAINSLSAVHFNQTGANAFTGNMLTINEATDTSLDWGTGDFFVAVVSDFDNDVTKGQSLGAGNFFSKTSLSTTPVTGVFLYGNIPSSATNPTVGAIAGTQASVSNFVSTATAYNTGAPHQFAIRRQGVAIDLYVDGASVASSTSGSINVTNNMQIRIGADGDASFVRLDGDIGEIVAVKGVLAASDQTGITGYLKSKWATP